MTGLPLFFGFSLWYYSKAFQSILQVWLNFMWFIVHYFSIPLLLRTLFAPWRRMTDTTRPRDIEDMLTRIVMNIMTRVFGAIVRLFAILTGTVLLILGVFGLVVVLACWIVMPLFLCWSLIHGLVILLG